MKKQIWMSGVLLVCCVAIAAPAGGQSIEVSPLAFDLEFLKPGDIITQTLVITDTAPITFTNPLGWGIAEAITSCAVPSDLPWLSESPISGTVLPGQSASVEVVARAPTAKQMGLLCVNSNDPTQPVVSIAVEVALAGWPPTGAPLLSTVSLVLVALVLLVAGIAATIRRQSAS